jgi:hypothetical protein
MKNCLDFQHIPQKNIIGKSNIALARATLAADSINTIVSRWLGLGNSWCISVAVRNACCRETPRLELKSSRTFLAIKRCQRIKIEKVVNSLTAKDGHDRPLFDKLLGG